MNRILSAVFNGLQLSTLACAGGKGRHSSAFTRCLMFTIWLWPLMATAQTDVTGQFKISGTHPTLNSSSQTYDSTVTLLNKNKSKAVDGPLTLVVTKASKPGIRLANASGETAKGRFIAIPLSSSSLGPNQSVSNITLKFTNPKQIAFTYGVKLYSGSLQNVLPNQVPVANAGENQTVATGNSALLDASRSSDVEGDTLSYEWTLQSSPPGSTAQLIDAATVHASFTPDLDGRYVVQLRVNDGHQFSSPDSVVIDTVNSPPSADAGYSILAPLKKPAVLDGSQSIDPDGDSLNYKWSLKSQPKGSKAALSNTDLAHATLVADKKGDYWAGLVVNDGNSDSKPASVLISTVNTKPVANPGPVYNALINQALTLDGSGSFDNDRDLISFKWSLLHKPDSSQTQLTDRWTVKPQLTPDQLGEYLAQLQVSDGVHDSDPVTVRINAQAPSPTPIPSNSPPTITSQPVISAMVGVLYQYTVTATDSDLSRGDKLSYALTVAPNGMNIDSVSGLIQWTPDSGQVGSQNVSVQVSDLIGATDTQSFTINVAAPAALTSVPNLVGQARGLTRKLLLQSNLALGNENFQHSASVAEGLVISQSIAATSQAAVGTSVDVVISIGPDTGLPPNPQTVASVLSANVVPTVGKDTQFLYTGSGAIQTGVAPGTIQEVRAAVVRGRVLDKLNQPLPGVTITIKDHPEYGQTLSRNDGQFDMAVNGGGLLTVNYIKTGYPSLQRQVNVAWQGYGVVDDVVMIAMDSKVNAIDLTSNSMQVAQGSPVTDGDGSRQATLMIPPGTQAQIYLPNGSTQAVSNLKLHLTEYTVGDNGPKAMPGSLPPTSAYTYAIDIKAEEAGISQNGTEVVFNQPVPFYVDNFLNFPIGEPAPLGYYDEQKAAWVAADSGRVIKIVNIANGMADIDSDGDGAADTALGLSDAERQNLASLYPLGKSLWRVMLPHLSAWDVNWGWSPPDDAISPNPTGKPSTTKDNVSDPSCSDGSIIECENQVLGERINLAGTGLSLNYRSSRQYGSDSNKVNIPLSGATIPASLSRIDVVIDVAGRRFIGSVAPSANASYVFNWDGLDPYGRPVFGWQNAKISIGFVYPLLRQKTTKFGYYGNGNIITADRRAAEAVFWKYSSATIAVDGWTSYGDGLGGWTLSNHHVFDPIRGLNYLGSGPQIGESATFNNVISTFAGNGYISQSPTFDFPATMVSIGTPDNLAVAPDGTVYISDPHFMRIFKVGADGKLKLFAGKGSLFFSADGIPAINEGLSVGGMAFAPDGSLLICDGSNARVRKIDSKGIITTIAGNGNNTLSGDGGSASQAGISYCGDIAVASDGTVYFADAYRIRRISTDGVISTFAGTGQTTPGPDGGQASATSIGLPMGLAIAPDGSVYFSAFCIASIPDGTPGCNSVRRISPSGIVTTVVGNGHGSFSGEGIPAINAGIAPGRIAFDADGSLLIVDRYKSPASGQYINNRIRRVDTNGIIMTIAGSGNASSSGDGGPTVNAGMMPIDVAVMNDGGRGSTLFIADRDNHRIRQIKPQMPEFNAGDIVLPSQDRTEVYHFNPNGLHLETLNALTGAVKYQFSYDGNERLQRITDGYGKVTSIERDSSGNPLAIVGPYGQRTTFTLDANGYLSKVTDTAGNAYQMVSTTTGLLTKFTDPNQSSSTFSYDAAGKLLVDANAAGGSQTLARNAITDGYQVTKTSALGRTTGFDLKKLTTGEQARTTHYPNGTSIQTINGSNGISTTTTADGSIKTLTQSPDARFGMSAPIVGNYQIKTGGLTSNESWTQQVSLTNPNDPLTLNSLNESLNINGRVTTKNYTAYSRNRIITSPAGRTVSKTMDTMGKLVQVQVGNLAPVNRSYDAQGRLTSITQGTGSEQRSTSFTYTALGYIATITDSAGNSTNYDYDNIGRVTRKTLADGRQIQFAYDGIGNLTSVTPPGRPAHRFGFTPIGLTQNYQPPAVNVANDTSYTYNLDKQLTQQSRPDGLQISLTYDAAGRLSGLNTPEGTIGYSFDGTTGKLTKVTTPDGASVTDTYNGALKTQTVFAGTVSGSIGYSYDNDFAVNGVTLNGGNNVAYSYDNDKLITKAGNLNLTRDSALGAINATSLGIVADTRTRNSFGEVASIAATVSTSNLIGWQYGYDQLGRIVQIQETVGSTSATYAYSYDLVGRLTEISKNGVSQAKYTWDSNGNRLSYQNAGGTVVNGQYDDQDRLLSYGDAHYSYGNNGELQSKTAGTATTNYQYDVLGNLKQVILPGGKTLDYLVDGYNRRIGKKVNGSLVQGFLYHDKLKLIAELDGANNLVSQFVYASRVNVPDYMIKNGVTYRIVTDHLGSPREVVDVASGTIMQELRYDEFGQVLYDSNPGFQPFGYAGGLYDKDSGLVRFGARDYDASVGRWISKDPLLMGGLDTNIYAYAAGNPINLIDPEGTKVSVCWIGYGDSNPFSQTSHQWIETDTQNMGMGRVPGTVSDVEWQDNTKYTSNPDSITCKEIPDVDEGCVNSSIHGKIGTYFVDGTCQDAVSDVINQCSTSNQAKESLPPNYEETFVGLDALLIVLGVALALL